MLTNPEEFNHRQVGIHLHTTDSSHHLKHDTYKSIESEQGRSLHVLLSSILVFGEVLKGNDEKHRSIVSTLLTLRRHRSDTPADTCASTGHQQQWIVFAKLKHTSCGICHFR